MFRGCTGHKNNLIAVISPAARHCQLVLEYKEKGLVDEKWIVGFFDQPHQIVYNHWKLIGKKLHHDFTVF